MKIGLCCLLPAFFAISGCTAPAPVYHGTNGRWIDRGPSLFGRYAFEIQGIKVGDPAKDFDFEKFPDGNYFIGIHPVEERCEQQRERLLVHLSVSRLLEDSNKDLLFGASGLLSDMPKTMVVATGFLNYHFPSEYPKIKYAKDRKAGSQSFYHDKKYRFTLDINVVDGGADLDDCSFVLTMSHTVFVKEPLQNLDTSLPM